MTGTRLSDSPTEVPSAEPAPSARLAIVRERLAGGFYQRPEVLERIVAAVRRALGRPD